MNSDPVNFFFNSIQFYFYSNAVLSMKVKRVLLDLKLAIEGTIIMSPDLRQAMDAMYDARVPHVWKQISWESSTLGFWFTEFLERNAQFQRWCHQVPPSSAILHPQSSLMSSLCLRNLKKSHKNPKNHFEKSQKSF